MTTKAVHNTFLSSLLFLFTFIMAACSSSDGEVSIEGRLLHMNQATFYVYSTDGAIQGIDTIQVKGGRFEYNKYINSEGTLVIIFPNYSQMPVFVKPGASITIKGDAANLKKMEIKGTSDNSDYTEWRENNENASPIEQKQHAELFIKDNPGSLVSLWLLRQYYIVTEKPDRKTAISLLKEMHKQEMQNANVTRMLSDISAVGNIAVGDKIGSFSATDMKGNAINNKMMKKGRWIVITCASWNPYSHNMLRRLTMKNNEATAQQTHDSHIVAICLDESKRDCKSMLRDCQADAITAICDTAMWDSQLLKVFGLTTVPDNVVIQDGKVVKRRVPEDKLQ